jgi:hypothetical protein
VHHFNANINNISTSMDTQTITKCAPNHFSC